MMSELSDDLGMESTAGAGLAISPVDMACHSIVVSVGCPTKGREYWHDSLERGAGATHL